MEVKVEKLNKSAYFLIISLAINTICSIFIDTFLVAKILELSNYNLTQVGIFFVITHLALGITYLLVTELAKVLKKQTLMAIGIFLKLSLILSVIFLDESMINYIALLGAFYGIAEGFFWVGCNVIKSLVVKHAQMKSLITYINVLGKAVGITFPIFLAYCIDNFSFRITAIIIIVLSVLEFILMLFVKSTEKDDKDVKYKEFYNATKPIGYDRIVKYQYWTTFLRGLKNNTSYIITYLIVLIFNTNMSLGIFSTIVSVLSIFVMFLYNLFSKNERVNILSTICAVLSSLSIVLVAFYLNKTTLIIFNFVYLLSIAVVDNVNESRRFNLTKHLGFENYTLENLSMSEVILNIGRIISESLMIVIGLCESELITTICLLFIAVVVAVYSIMNNKLENIVHKFDFKQAKIKLQEMQTQKEIKSKNNDN